MLVAVVFKTALESWISLFNMFLAYSNSRALWEITEIVNSSHFGVLDQKQKVKGRTIDALPIHSNVKSYFYNSALKHHFPSFTDNSHLVTASFSDVVMMVMKKKLHGLSFAGL